MNPSERAGRLGLSAELVIRPSTPGRSSAGGVSDVEPRFSHSSDLNQTRPRAEAPELDPVRRHELRRALLDLERRTAGRRPDRSERRLAEHYRHQLGHDLQGES